MQRTKKQILGALGLGLVTAMTAVAVALPAPSASAAIIGGPNIDLKVVVHTQTPSTVIQYPSDGSEYATNLIPISNIYSKATTVHYQLTHVDSNGVRTDYTLPDYVAATTGTADGTHDWTLDLGNYGGGAYGQYILTSTVGAVSDYVSFIRNSIVVSPTTTTNPSTGDPVVTVDYDDNVCSLKFQAYHNATGTSLFNPEYSYAIPTPRPTPSTAQVTLPFGQYNANAGDYRVVVTAYGCGSNQNSTVGDPDDTVIGNYRPQDDITIDPNSGDPIIKFRYDFNVEVCMVKFQAFHKTTNAALFHPEYEHGVNPPSKSGTIQVTLPFAKYVAESGDFTITATFYDCGGNVLSNRDWTLNGYTKPLVPGVPDTGGGFFAGLNFSRGDYLATGLIIFMLALIIAIRVMSKNRKSSRR